MEPSVLTRREELLLLAVHNLRDDAYLVAITDYLETVTEERLSLPTIHRPLNRLLRKGLIWAEFGEATAVRGGRRKKIYHITKTGYAVLSSHQRLSDRLWEGFVKMTLNIKEKG